ITQGYRFATADENRQKYYQDEYGARPGAALILGALRSVTFGGSDVIADAAGEADAVREIAAHNPGASLIGEIGGYAPPRRAGELLGKAGKAIAEHIGSKIVGGIARGAAEGGLVGIQQTISDAALSDHPASAEWLISTLGSNVLNGAKFGAGVGGLTGIISAA